jgi:hypothetical protein
MPEKRFKTKRTHAGRAPGRLPREEGLYSIHYSSDLPTADGGPRRLFAIAVQNVATENQHMFSMLKIAKRLGRPPDRLLDRPDELEQALLKDFASFLRGHRHSFWMHWGMRTAEYGFDVILQRVQAHRIKLPELPEQQRFDLAGYLKRRHGPSYAPHPRLVNAAKLNGCWAPTFLSNEESAAAWKNGEYGRVQQSLADKVDVIADLYRREKDGTFRCANYGRNGQTLMQPTLAPKAGSVESAAPVPFKGGPMAFFDDRVELCGAVICRRNSTGKARKLLDLLKKQRNGSFVAYSGEEVARALDVGSGQNGVAGLVRDIRAQISEALHEGANMECGRHDVILSGGPGYRLKEWITVKEGDDQGHGRSTTAADDPDRDTDHDPDREPDDPNGATARRRWILKQLANGVRLQAPHLVQQFGRSLATAKRDLQAMRDAKKIEFTGKARTGFYRLTRPPAQAED